MKNLKTYDLPHNLEIDEKFHQFNIGNIANVVYWNAFFDLISNVEGDIVECGVGRGRSLIILSALNYFTRDSKLGERQVFAYDSFEGFPEPTEEDESGRNPQKGEWSESPSGKYKYSPEFLSQILTEAGLSPNDRPITITKGYFNDSLPSHPQRPIAILHVDGDLYQSYKDTLENLYPLVSKGGIIIFDDFLAQEDEDEDFPGARTAVKEFLGEKFSDLKVSIGGTTYFIKDE